MSRTLTETSQPLTRRQFGSDNYAGICPEAWQALSAANTGHAMAYGDDPFTAQAAQRIQDWFEIDCEVFLTFTGTAANALAMLAMCQSYHAVICHAHSHLNTDECAAPEFFTGGAKLLPVSGDQAKLTPAAIEARITQRTDVHYCKSRAVSITQATEVGTVYSVDEVRALADVAQRYELGLHMDGARFANAVASLDVAPADVTWRVGVDVLSLGGTKVGLPMGEALVFFNDRFSRDFAFRRKQAAQLCSKMRFLAAPWIGVLTDGALLRHAQHANNMALRLRRGLEEIGELELPFPTQANSVFIDMPVEMQHALFDRGWKFYALIGDTICRLMCAWDTTVEDVDAFLDDVRQVV